MPPCTSGCSVTTRWPRIAGTPGELGDIGDGDAGVGDGARRAAARHERPAEVGEAAGEVDDAGLVVHGQQGGGHARTVTNGRHAGRVIRDSRSGETPDRREVGYGRGARRERAPRGKAIRVIDWLKAIGSMLFLVAAILPWWTREYTGFELRRTGFGYWLGIIAAVAILAVGLSDGDRRDRVAADPPLACSTRRAMLAAGHRRCGRCVGVRFFLDRFGRGDPGIRDSRGLGLYLAGAGAVLVLIGCVMAFQRPRASRRTAVAHDERATTTDERRPRRVRLRRRRAGRADPAHQRVDASGSRTAAATAPPTAPQPTVQQQRKAERAERAPTRRRRPTGPPIP